MMLDLGCWRYTLNGAEPIRSMTLEKFGNTFAPCGFAPLAHSPAYGLAEATLVVTLNSQTSRAEIKQLQAEALRRKRIITTDEVMGSRAVVGCGTTTLDTQVIIVNPVTLTQCAFDEIGEIWVGGPTVAQGYWENEEATQATFRAHLADSGEGPFLRTGDLGFLKDRELFITGRMKDLIIIHGRNHYPQDIELTTERSHPACRAGWGAAFSVSIDENDGNNTQGIEKLVVVQEIERTALRSLNGEEVIWAIRRAIAEEHELQPDAVVLTKPGSIPKTTSGKVQRIICRTRFLKNQFVVLDNWQNELGTSIAMPNNSMLSNAKQQHQIEHRHNRAHAIIAWLRTYATTRINSRLMDERRSIPPHIILDLGNHGFLGLQVPERYGGMNLNYRDALWVYEQVASIDLTLASFLAVHNALGIRPILKYALMEQRNALIPKLATGRELASFAITEPGAGSNPRAIAATATPIGENKWQLNGQKSWIGNGSWAGVTNLFVQLLDNEQTPMGITGFVLSQEITPLSQGPEALTLGL